MPRYLAAYDISHDARRRAVARALARWGERVQESVFHLRIDADELDDVRLAIGLLLETTDRFDVVPIDDRPDRRQFSWQRVMSIAQPVIML